MYGWTEVLLHALLISAEVSFMARPPYARGKSAQYSLDRRMVFPRANLDTVRKTFLPLSRIRLHSTGRKPSQHADWANLNPGRLLHCSKTRRHNAWLTACFWRTNVKLVSKQTQRHCFVLDFYPLGLLSRRLNSCFTFCYRMEGPWHICHYNVRLHQKSYCRIWENLYSTHIWINQSLRQWTPHHYPQNTNPVLLRSHERHESTSTHQSW